MPYEAFIKAVESANTFLLTGHVGPDGDALGSMLAMQHGLLQKYPNKTVTCIIAGKKPDLYHFLPGMETLKVYEKDFESLLPQYDAVISFDCGSSDRLGPIEAYFKAAKISTNVDHHVSNENFGQINILETDAGASGEVVAHLLDAMGITYTKAMAECLYVTILTDTGGFKYSSTTPNILRLTARLIEYGANPEQIYKQVYEIATKAQMLLQADALSKVQFNKAETIGWTIVMRTDFDRFGALDEHLEGLVESIRRVDSIKIAAILKETLKGETKVSLRSDDHAINVAEIMGTFGGGGHKMAAGCTIAASPAEAFKQLYPLLEAKLA